MAQKSRSALKQRYITGAKPTQADFADFIDSAVNVVDDKGAEDVNKHLVRLDGRISYFGGVEGVIGRAYPAPIWLKMSGKLPNDGKMYGLCAYRYRRGSRRGSAVVEPERRLYIYRFRLLCNQPDNSPAAPIYAPVPVEWLQVGAVMTELGEIHYVAPFGVCGNNRYLCRFAICRIEGAKVTRVSNFVQIKSGGWDNYKGSPKVVII